MKCTWLFATCLVFAHTWTRRGSGLSDESIVVRSNGGKNPKNVDVDAEQRSLKEIVSLPVFGSLMDTGLMELLEATLRAKPTPPAELTADSTVVTPAAAPIVITQASEPTVVTPAAAPIVVTQASEPTVVTQATGPTAVTKGSGPTVLTQAAGPTVATKGSGPTVVTEGSGPTAAVPVAPKQNVDAPKKIVQEAVLAIPLWLFPTFAAFVAWGFWAFLGSLAEKELSPQSVFQWHNVSQALLAIVLIPFVFEKVSTGKALLDVACGASYGVGAYAMIIAMQHGKTVSVVMVTSMYPFVVVLVNHVVFRDAPGIMEIIGIIPAMLALWLLARDDEDERNVLHGGHLWMLWSALSVFCLGGYVFGSELVTRTGFVSMDYLYQALGLVVSAILLAALDHIWPSQVKTHPLMDKRKSLAKRFSQTMPDKSFAAVMERVPEENAQDADSSCKSVLSNSVIAALGMGVVNVLGIVCFMRAIQLADDHSLTAVVVLSGMYPLASLFLAYIFLNEKLTVRQCVGVVFAVTACVLLSLFKDGLKPVVATATTLVNA